MGRQTAVVLSNKDEVDFLARLRELGPIRIFEDFAPTIAELWVDEFAPEYSGHISYSIWPTEFEWEPEYGVVTQDRTGRRNGWRFVDNRGDAPVLEYSRPRLSATLVRPGRLYWAGHFSAPQGLAYSSQRFSSWYDKVVAWIRKQGRKPNKEKGIPYFLPDALGKYGSVPLSDL